MALSTIIELFKRDLKILKTEIESYSIESDLWKVEPGIINCGGNICLHIVGNLNAFIGAELGNTGYVRKRDLEFSQKNVPRNQLTQMVDDTSKMIEEVLGNLDADQLKKDYPVDVFKRKMSTEFFLIHLNTHLTYHRGQINYHRRLLAF